MAAEAKSRHAALTTARNQLESDIQDTATLMADQTAYDDADARQQAVIKCRLDKLLGMIRRGPSHNMGGVGDGDPGSSTDGSVGGPRDRHGGRPPGNHGAGHAGSPPDSEPSDDDDTGFGSGGPQRPPGAPPKRVSPSDQLLVNLAQRLLQPSRTFKISGVSAPTFSGARKELVTSFSGSCAATSRPWVSTLRRRTRSRFASRLPRVLCATTRPPGTTRSSLPTRRRRRLLSLSRSSRSGSHAVTTNISYVNCSSVLT